MECHVTRTLARRIPDRKVIGDLVRFYLHIGLFALSVRGWVVDREGRGSEVIIRSVGKCVACVGQWKGPCGGCLRLLLVLSVTAGSCVHIVLRRFWCDRFEK